MPHPAALIFLWASLVIAMQSLQVTALLLSGVLLLIIACLLCAARFLILLRRTRWIMLSLLLIFAYATPGNALWPALAQFSPTLEGLADGLLQGCRLIFVLAALAILLHVLPQQQLMNGLYTLSSPLRHVGLPPERLAVRLALTLHYAEANLLHPPANWQEHIEHMLTPQPAAQHSIVLHDAPYTWLDRLLWVIGCVLLLGVLL